MCRFTNFYSPLAGMYNMVWSKLPVCEAITINGGIAGLRLFIKRKDFVGGFGIILNAV